MGAVHLIGASMAFGFGIVYEWMQAVMSYKMFSNRGQIRVVITRIIIALCSTIFAVISKTSSGEIGKRQTDRRILHCNSLAV